MAFYEKRSKNTYKLVVCQGYDSNGKKLRKTKTIKIDEKLTSKQLEKELNMQKVLFEKEVLQGDYLDGEHITFSEFTVKWLKNYAEINLSPATLVSYKHKLSERILPAIGHLKLCRIQPTHILQFYRNLHEEGIRLDYKYKPNTCLLEYLKDMDIHQVVNRTNISLKTCKRLFTGRSIDISTAKRLCNGYKIPFNQYFILRTSTILSEKTIRNHIGIICSILSTAVKWNIIKDNPVRRIELKKVIKQKAKYYDDINVANMLKCLDTEPLMYKTMIYLAIDTGLRKSELTGLTWSDVDFNKSQININKQRHYVMGYGTINAKPKTEAGARIVTLSQTALSLLKKYRNLQIQQKLSLGTAWKNSPYIFVNEEGQAISTNQPYKWFINFLERYNLPKITFHQLRHTNASLLISSGEDIVTISSRLGHADKNITLNTYSHLIKSREKQVANKMDIFYSDFKISCV